MPRISKVEVCAVRVPLDQPVQFSTRNVTAREFCLVRICSDDNARGIGYSGITNTGGKLVYDAVVDALAPLVVGDDSHRVEGIWEDLYRATLLLGRAGALARAQSALDIALWDLNARAVGVPLYRYLGACNLVKVPAYGSGGYYRVGKTNADLAQEMKRFVDCGYKAVKMKVGNLSPSDDAERVRAVREAIGPDVHLMLDANNAWSDLPTALLYMRRIEPYNPYWIEEPFLPDDIDNHAALSSKISTVVATGEIEAGRWRFKELIEKKAAQILQPDATVCGGITEWRRIASTAASHGITVSPHARHDIHIHLVASAPNATYVEFMPDDHITNFRRLIDSQLTMENGYLLLPQGAGLGFDFDEAAVERYGVRDAQGSVWRTIC